MPDSVNEEEEEDDDIGGRCIHGLLLSMLHADILYSVRQSTRR